jgi:hypothetical protein
MKITASAVVTIVAFYFADELITDGQYRRLFVRMIRPVGATLGIFF